jgi:hypothetical protein
MPLVRKTLLGPPHTYLVKATTAQNLALFDGDEAEHFLTLLETVRSAFAVRVFAYQLDPNGFRLIFRHSAHANDTDDALRRRWTSVGGSLLTPVTRLKQRFTTLSGFMQTLLQRYSRSVNRRTGRRGHVWSGRYRACLLADDLGLLASVAWIEATTHHKTISSSATWRQSSQQIQNNVTLSPLPLRLGPDGMWFTADESPPGLPPLRDAQVDGLFAAFTKGLPAADMIHYGQALEHGWAFGRPESLSQTIARLSRPSGRGRSRSVHDLDDALGLCGVWG